MDGHGREAILPNQQTNAKATEAESSVDQPLATGNQSSTPDEPPMERSEDMVMAEEYKEKVRVTRLSRDELSVLPFTTLLILSTSIAMKIENLMSLALNRMTKDIKESLSILSQNQVIITKLIEECSRQLLDQSVPVTRERTRISTVPITPQDLPTEVVVPLEILAKENISMRKQIAKLESNLPPNVISRNEMNQNGLRGRVYNFSSAINCCSATALVRGMDNEKKGELMTLANTLTMVYPSWKSSVIVLDSICTCKGASSECPVKKAVSKINSKFPESNARYTERFWPRVKVNIEGFMDDPDNAWKCVKDAFPSSEEILGTTPKLITKWKNLKATSSAFIFEVKPSVRTLIAGRKAKSRIANMVITDSIYVPICRKCQKLGHHRTRCTAESEVQQSNTCRSCSVNNHHHPLSYDCSARDRIIRSKLSRIDYGPEFRNKVVLYQ